MKYILQIFSGPWHKAHAAPGAIIKRISDIASRITVDKVIIGWNIDADMYRQIGSFLRLSGIKMLLWLPVFSEISGIAEPDRALDIFGNTVNTPIEQDGEDFVFGCPSSARNVRIVKDIYQKYFSKCKFDGVFLDKIRSQSFVSGVSGVLSCCCERCERAFRDRGVDLSEVRERYLEKRDSFFDISRFPMTGEFKLKDDLAQRFFEVKETIIADAVNDISGYFREMGLIMGLDLFAPVVSRFVGQNYSMITKNTDFIKPMLYRRTEAPAGIGYEYSLFAKHAPAANDLISPVTDRRFLSSQLEAMKSAGCEVYPGIEINYNEDIARTDPEYIIESLTAVRDHGFTGAALCWNAMLAPETHIDAIAAMEKVRSGF